MTRFFFTALLCLTLMADITAVYAQDAVQEAAQDSEKKKSEELTPFLRDSTLSGALYYFQRYRNRYNVDEDRYMTNLNHASTQVSAEFNSGYLGGFIGIDFGAFGSLDFYNRGSPDHEMNFFPWNNPWEADWSKTDTQNGASIYKANVKMRAGPVWGKVGYFQPSGPGVLGVNWSFLPGTYQGAEAGGSFGDLTVAAAWANEYKAPWFRDTYGFRQNDGVTPVSYLWSLGGRYELGSGLDVEVAYGESENYLKNAHMKAKYNLLGDKRNLYLTWQVYAMGDSDNSGSVNDNFDGMAMQQFLAMQYGVNAWTFRAEFTYTSAPMNNDNNVGYFAYRLTSANGGSKGAYEPWWDLRSDWNHDQEKAVFANISRDLSDLGLTGISVGASYAQGWDGKAYGYSTRFREEAYGGDIAYTFQKGSFEGSMVKLHYTRYDNKTDLPSWTGFKNAFQDEHDIKFSVVIPFSIK